MFVLDKLIAKLNENGTNLVAASFTYYFSIVKYRRGECFRNFVEGLLNIFNSDPGSFSQFRQSYNLKRNIIQPLFQQHYVWAALQQSYLSGFIKSTFNHTTI